MCWACFFRMAAWESGDTSAVCEPPCALGCMQRCMVCGDMHIQVLTWESCVLLAACPMTGSVQKPKGSTFTWHCPKKHGREPVSQWWSPDGRGSRVSGCRGGGMSVLADSPRTQICRSCPSTRGWWFRRRCAHAPGWGDLSGWPAPWAGPTGSGWKWRASSRACTAIEPFVAACTLWALAKPCRIPAHPAALNKGTTALTCTA